VKKSAQPGQAAVITLKTVLQPVNSAVISGVEAVRPVERMVSDTIHAAGYLAFDTRTYNNIAARFSGRVEKLYIKYAFEEVHKGQRIMDVYSPEMVTAQQDLLFVLKHSPDQAGLINAARQKLLLLGMTEAQLRTLVKTGGAFYSLPVYSPYDGHVHDVAHSQMNASTSTANTAVDYAQNMPLAVKEGMYVNQGQTLFNIVDPHRLWAVLKINPADAGRLRLGQPVTVHVPDQEMAMEGKVDFIEPTLQAGDRSTSIRVYLSNHDHRMKVGSLAEAEIAVRPKEGLWVPRTAVISLGGTSVVWLKDGAVYRAHAVQTGAQTADQIQISRGLSAEDSVAVNAQYLSDSDSFIKTDHEVQ
jgi:Cu(I)/Ag(I) efflux system membrane fusion protein